MLQGGELLRIKTAEDNGQYIVAQVMHVTKNEYDNAYYTAMHEGNVFDLEGPALSIRRTSASASPST